jgi:hypothetical protein
VDKFEVTDAKSHKIHVKNRQIYGDCSMYPAMLLFIQAGIAGDNVFLYHSEGFSLQKTFVDIAEELLRHLTKTYSHLIESGIHIPDVAGTLGLESRDKNPLFKAISYDFFPELAETYIALTKQVYFPNIDRSARVAADTIQLLFQICGAPVEIIADPKNPEETILGVAALKIAAERVSLEKAAEERQK